MKLKHALLALTMASVSAPAMAQLAMNEEYADGYDHSLQNYVTEKFFQPQNTSQASTSTPEKKWKVADYVTVPKFGGYVVSTYKYDSQEVYYERFELVFS